MPTRIDLYRAVHKGQRDRMFAIARDLGMTSPADESAVREVAQRCLAITDELREHAENEDAFIHPLLRARAPEAAEQLDAEHVRLDVCLASLDEEVADLLAATQERSEILHQVYLSYNQLLSAYLSHLHIEETVAMPALWRTCTDPELGEILRSFSASRSPEQRAGDMRKMLPSLSHDERVAMIGNVMAATAPDDQARVFKAITGTLDDGQLKALAEHYSWA